MKYIILLFSILSFQAGQTQPGFLDPSFGDEGKEIIYTGDECYTVAVQRDGKILMGGAGYHNNDTGYMITRLLPDGSIDSSFADEGFSVLNFSEFGFGTIWDLKIQTDGKIIAAASVGDGSVFLARYKDNGSLDSSFGTNGTSKALFDDYTTVYTLQIQPDGKYVFAGDKSNNMNRDIVVLRFKHDGALDGSFGNNGEVVISQNDAAAANAIVLQPDGKIIVGGEAFTGSHEFFLARLNTDGTLDESFSNDGMVITNIEGGSEYIYSLVLQPDGKIVAAGISSIYREVSNNRMAVSRYNSNGDLDETFGKQGTATIKFNNLGSRAGTVLLQDDGKLILAGQVYDESVTHNDMALARLDADGNIDSSFGVDGRQVTDIAGSDGQRDAELQQDGKILLTGFSYFNKKYYYAIARYLNDGVMPLHFTYFNAAPTGNGGIALNWQTAQENNNNYFAVERSASNNFSEIVRINSQGNSSQAQTYSYTDNTPLQGTNFYRLKQVDKDGKFSYSQVVSATIQNGLTVVLYPNPVKDILNIKGLDAGMNYNLSVMSVKGGVVAQTSINDISTYNWNLQSLSKGVYYLTIVSNNRKTTVKFVKD